MKEMTTATLLDALQNAVARSMSHDEIVRVEVDDVEQARILLCTLCDDDIEETDWVDTDGMTDVWCYDSDDDMVWRVYLVQADSE